MENTIEIEESKGKNKGFTLVELLIVIVILGILAAVTVFAVRGITEEAETNACAVDKKNYETAIEAYFAVENTYPASAASIEGDLVPAYVKSIPENWTYVPPVSGGDYSLTGSGSCAAPTATTVP